jgi:hypothetical protein
VVDTGEYEVVYNLRVADHHTYFVGCDEWGFSAWAHNAYDQLLQTIPYHSRGELVDGHNISRVREVNGQYVRVRERANVQNAWELYSTRNRPAFDEFVTSLGVDPATAWAAAAQESRQGPIHPGPTMDAPIPRNLDGSPLFPNLLETMPPAPGNSHYNRHEATRVFGPDLPRGEYVFLQDAYGVVWVAENGPHHHPMILGRGEHAASAGVVEVGRGGSVTRLINDSGTFHPDVATLANVAHAIEAYGGQVLPGAIQAVQL